MTVKTNIFQKSPVYNFSEDYSTHFSFASRTTFLCWWQPATMKHFFPILGRPLTLAPFFPQLLSRRGVAQVSPSKFLPFSGFFIWLSYSRHGIFCSPRFMDFGTLGRSPAFAARKALARLNDLMTSRHYWS